MSFSTTYKKLFQVDILHGYHLNDGAFAFDTFSQVGKQEKLIQYDIGRDIEIVPTRETQKLLAGYKLIFKQSGTGFFVGIKLDQQALSGGTFKPFVPIESPLKLTFALKLINPYFFNFTSLRLDGNRGNPYFFTNLNGNVKGSKVFASKPISAFNTSIDYRAGDFYINNGGPFPQLFEAVQNTAAAGAPVGGEWEEVILAPDYAPGTYNEGDVVIFGGDLYRAKADNIISNPPTPADWEALGLFHEYVTHQDRIPLYGPNIPIDLTGQNVTKARIRLLRSEDNSEAYKTEIESTTPFSIYQTRFEGVAPGRYKLEFTNLLGPAVIVSPDEFYMDGQLTRENLFGIVEINHLPTSLDDEKLLIQPALQELKAIQPAFTIRFKNRSTYWRYIFKEDQVGPFGSFVANTPGETKKFKSINRLPLTKAFQEINRFTTTTLLPNAGVVLVKPDKDDDFKIYSEIFVHV